MAASLADLKPDLANARAHNPRNIGMIADALQQVGAARSIVVDEDNVILAGNGVVQAAAKAGIRNVRIIEAEGDEIIAVRRSNLTQDQKIALKYFDNRTAELAEWDQDQVAADPVSRLRIVATAYERKRKYPGLWIHLLGYTPDERLNAYPMDSADSTTWMSAVTWGCITYDRADGQMVQEEIRKQSPVAGITLRLYGGRWLQEE